MSKRTRMFWNPRYKADKLEEVIPYTFEYRGKNFFKVKEYENFVLYEYDYGNGNYKECFDRHELKCLARYGKDLLW